MMEFDDLIRDVDRKLLTPAGREGGREGGDECIIMR